MDARKLLVPLADVPVASLLKISNNYALRLLFQAKVDRLYLTCGVKLQEYCETHSRVPSDSVTFAVSFIYSDDNITRLAWEAKKRTPNRDPKWKELKNVYAMRSLVLKQDVATMYKGYAEKMSEMMPGKRPIGRTLFYSIAKHITGGGKIQEARAGVDYIKVNFHTDNFAIIDKVIDALAPLSEIDHALHNELCGLRNNVHTFLGYGYAMHVKMGVKASGATEHHSFQPQEQEHDAQQFAEYEALERLISEPNAFDEPATQQEFVKQVRDQLNHCAQATAAVVEHDNDFATTHSPLFALDLVPN